MNYSKTYYGGACFDKDDLEEVMIKYKTELKYYIIEDNRNIKSRKLFGIEIVKEESKENYLNVETNHVRNITNNSDMINSIISVLRNNKVTPIALNDVMDDILKQEIAE